MRVYVSKTVKNEIKKGGGVDRKRNNKVLRSVSFRVRIRNANKQVGSHREMIPVISKPPPYMIRMSIIASHHYAVIRKIESSFPCASLSPLGLISEPGRKAGIEILFESLTRNASCPNRDVVPRVAWQH